VYIVFTIFLLLLLSLTVLGSPIFAFLIALPLALVAIVGLVLFGRRRGRRPKATTAENLEEADAGAGHRPGIGVSTSRGFVPKSLDD
jgi:hypothetical protein